MNRFCWGVLLFFLLLPACRFAPDEVRSYRHIPSEGWCADSLVDIVVPVTDTTGLYRIAVDLRFTDDYPYANLWLFLSVAAPDTLFPADTLSCTLSDKYGRWLGSGIGSHRQLEVPFRQAMRFPSSGEWHIFIQQGMRDRWLSGITEVGVKVSPE
ncbi:MAG: gliding motility lipoprotein GldH [Porphyromonadaceae bacterium]|nr:gliding motility lipoprotein GldH [Porphyromonadaceae bacterium]